VLPLKKVIDSPVQVDVRLAELLLPTRPTWTDSVREGTALALACTLNDPKGFAALSAWAKITRALRERTVPDRAKRTEVEGQAATLFKDAGISIIVAAGNEYTGRNTEFDPATRGNKGVVTKGALFDPGATLADDNEEFAKFLSEASKRVYENSVQAYAGTTTYILLYYIDADNGEIRFELSRPSLNGLRDGVIRTWVERILFPPIEIGAGTVVVVDDVDPAHQVVVSRKA